MATFQPSSAQKQQKYHLTREKQSCSRCFGDTWPQTLFLVTPHYHPLAESQVKEVHGTGPVSCQYGMRWWWSPQLLVEVPHKSPGSEYHHQYPAPSFHLPSPVEQKDWPSRILGWRFRGPLLDDHIIQIGKLAAVTLMLHDHSKTLCSPPSGLRCCPDWDTQCICRCRTLKHFTSLWTTLLPRLGYTECICRCRTLAAARICQGPTCLESVADAMTSSLYACFKSLWLVVEWHRRFTVNSRQTPFTT